MKELTLQEKIEQLSQLFKDIEQEAHNKEMDFHFVNGRPYLEDWESSEEEWEPSDWEGSSC